LDEQHAEEMAREQEKDARLAREANEDHRYKIHETLTYDLQLHGQISEAVAREIVGLLCEGKLRHARIDYS